MMRLQNVDTDTNHENISFVGVRRALPLQYASYKLTGNLPVGVNSPSKASTAACNEGVASPSVQITVPASNTDTSYGLRKHNSITCCARLIKSSAISNSLSHRCALRVAKTSTSDSAASFCAFCSI